MSGADRLISAFVAGLERQILRSESRGPKCQSCAMQPYQLAKGAGSNSTDVGR